MANGLCVCDDDDGIEQKECARGIRVEGLNKIVQQNNNEQKGEWMAERWSSFELLLDVAARLNTMIQSYEQR